MCIFKNVLIFRTYVDSYFFLFLRVISPIRETEYLKRVISLLNTHSSTEFEIFVSICSGHPPHGTDIGPTVIETFIILIWKTTMTHGTYKPVYIQSSFSICLTVIFLNIGFTQGLINKRICLVCKTEQTYQHFRHWFWQRTRAYPYNYTFIKHYRYYWVVFILIIEPFGGILVHAFFTFNGFFAN